MEELIKGLTDPLNVMMFAVGVMVFATVVTVAAPAFRGDKLSERLKGVANRREELRKASRAAMSSRDAGAALRRTDESWYKKVVEQLNLSKLLEDPKVVDKLAQAGLRGPGPVSRFYFFRFATPFVFAAMAAFYVFGVNHTLLPIQRMCVLVVAFVAGFYGPNLWVSNRVSKRRESIVHAFPDALDLLLICVESGMSIEAAVQKVGGEIGGRSIELAEEMALLTAELSYLPERRMAYEGLAKRTNHPGIKAVAVAMTQAERYGTPLGNALRVMAKENRDMRIAAAEKKASQLPAKLTVPMVLFFLPVIFIVILTPGLMKAFDKGGKSAQQQRIERNR
ncbi:type II secretion system F family protein [soil metagenome]